MFKKLMASVALLFSVVLVACSSQTKSSSETASSSSAAAQTQWEKIEEAGVLKVATPGTFWPTSFYNDKNELVGYEIELLNEIGKRLGVKVEYTELDVAESFTSVDNGTVDMAVNNFDITPERQEKYTISTPYKYSVGGMIVRADGSSGIEAADLSDWEGKKAAGAAGTTYMALAEKLGAEPVLYDNVTGDVYLSDVENGRTDFIPNDYYTQVLFVNMMAEDFPNIKMADVKYNPTEQGMIMKKGDDSLKAKIDPIIEEMKADGSLKKISETYYEGMDVSQPEKDLDKIPVIDPSK